MLMPSVFLAYGDPALVSEPDSRYARFLTALAVRLSKPQAIVIVSSHWVHPVQQITGATDLATLHDFGDSIPASSELNHVQYPAKGNILLSLDIQSRLAADSMRAEIDDHRGLDHGAWMLLRLLYPSARIPVVALSVNPRLVPEEHYRIGRALQGLRQQGVLIVGSGATRPRLSQELQPQPQPQQSHHAGRSSSNQASVLFDNWLDERIQLWDLEGLFDYEHRAPHVMQAGAREHLAPLLICMGAGEPELKGRRIYREYPFGLSGMSLICWKFG